MRQTLFLSLILVVEFRRHMCWVILMMSVTTAQAQERKYLDDQLQDVYNATTTLFTTQENIQYNQGRNKTIAEDMGISGMHRFTFVQQYGNKLQNLGNNGTATKPIFYVMPDNIGFTSGFHAYDIYFRNPCQVRYYDTKSPYSKMYVILARFGSFYADVCHSRNVTPNWNIGANFRNIMTDKEWISSRRGDKNVISYGLDFFTHYRTQNEQYQLLAHFLIAEHRVRETGGIYTTKYQESRKKNFENELWHNSMVNRLMPKVEDPKSKLESNDSRRRFYLYHQLALSEQLWTYHELEIRKETYQFKIDSLSEEAAVFLGGKESDNHIELKTTVWSKQNILGVKGDWQDLFYSGYYRHKQIECRPPKRQNNQDLYERYVGLHTRYNLGDKTASLHLGAEYLLQGGYKARVAYEGASFDLACERIKHKPSCLARQYHGYHRNWDHAFSSPTATQVRGSLQLADDRVQLKPYVSWTRVDNPIFFEQKITEPNYTDAQKSITIAEPKQVRNNVNIITLGTDLELKFGSHVRWDSELTTAKVPGPMAKIFSMPSLLINSKLYYTNTTTAGNGTFETGIDVHWKSSYKADGYDPVTQQFYFQDTFTVYSYPIIDLFLDFRIQSFSAFLKFSHCNESWLPATSRGYFVTPLYPGQRQAFDIGISWSFFD
jgi:hypothetical protein